MNVSLYQAAAAMNANARWQEMIAEHLAASSIPGSRTHEISFSAVAAGKSPGSLGVNGGNFVMPVSTTAVNFQQDMLRPTGLPTNDATK